MINSKRPIKKSLFEASKLKNPIVRNAAAIALIVQLVAILYTIKKLGD